MKRVGPVTWARVAAARAGLRPFPLYMSFEVTHRCNLACAYCDRHSPSDGEMTFRQAVAALADFIDMGMRSVSLDGGEPLTCKRIADLVDWLFQREVAILLKH